MAEGEELCVERRKEEDEGMEGRRATRQLVKERGDTYKTIDITCYLGNI